MPRALILGGTGVVGRATAVRLLHAGWDVDVTGHSALKFSSDVIDRGGQYLLSDRNDPQQLRHALGSGADLVVDCLCYGARDAEQLIPLINDVRSTVMISSKAVYADESGHHSNSLVPAHFPVPIHETQPTVTPGDVDVNSREGYGQSKIAAEHVLLDSGSNVTIVRASKVHGVGAVRPREWYFAKRALDRRPHVLLRNAGRHVDHPTAAMNMAALIEVTARAPGNRILNCADPDAPCVQDISRIVASALDHTFDEVFIDVDAPDEIGLSPWDSSFPIVLDMSAGQELGYSPAGTYAETVRDEVEWLASIAIDGEGVRLPEWLDNKFFKDSFNYDLEDSFLAAQRPRKAKRQ
jgi:nucleoside-diphosphate-sugar epimerase